MFSSRDARAEPIVAHGTQNALISAAIMARNYLPAHNYRRIVPAGGEGARH